MVDDLNPDAATLLRAGRNSFRPRAPDRDRVLDSLRARLGEGILVDRQPGGATHPAAAALRTMLQKWLLVGLPAIIGLAWIVARERAAPVSMASTAPAAPPAPVVATAAAESTAAPTAEAPASTAASLGVTAPAERPDNPPHAGVARSAARSTADSLRREVALLAKATRELSSGRAEDALQTLGEHERQFPSGALAQERMATRVEALCSLGRAAEAKRDLTKLARVYPRSAYLERARAVCGFSPGGAP
jgi:hypothetical protein